MAERKWFYELLMEEFGPVCPEQINVLLSDRTLSSTDRVRAEDSSAWITVAEMQTSSGDDNSNPEVITDLSELSFSFGDSNASIDSLPGQPDMDAFRVEGDSDSPLPQDNHRQAETEAEEPEVVYFVESLGQVLGPMPWPELILMADSHVLSAADKVREGEFGSWQAVDNMPELAAALINLNSDDVDTPAAPDSTAPQETVPEHTVEISTSMADTLSEANSQQVQPSAGQSGSVELPKQKTNRRPKKKRRTRRPKIDELKEDDFAAVFSTPASPVDHAAPTPQPAEPAVPASTDSLEPAVQETPMGVASKQSSPVPSYTPPAQFEHASAAAASLRSEQAAPSKKRNRSAGFSFELPDPRVMGFVGGILAVILLIVAAVSGYIPMPGSATDPAAVLAEFSGEYQQLANGTISEAAWKEFQTRARSAIVAANKHFMGKGELSPEEFKTRLAIGKLGALINVPADDAQRQADAFKTLQHAMAAL